MKDIYISTYMSKYNVPAWLRDVMRDLQADIENPCDEILFMVDDSIVADL